MGAVRGLVRSMLSLLGESGVTHVAVAFDHVIESFRNRLFPGYKTGEGIDPDLLAQFHPAEDAMRALGVVVWPMVEFEADDALCHRRGAFCRGPAGRAGGRVLARQGPGPMRARDARRHPGSPSPGGP